jgi:uncharacterized DUF497 family protein
LSRVHKFECDKVKARSNFQKHKIRFTEGCRIFEGHTLTSESIQNSTVNETRYITIGVLNPEVAAVVVWTKRQNNIRVISVRTASSQERKRFDAHIKNATN